MTVVITGPNGENTTYDLSDGQVVTITIDGQELIGVMGGDGAGWWPTGDGGERNSDWTPLRPTGP
jgi:hypothetical protein